MTTVNRRHFIMSSLALPVALKASDLQSPNNTIRLAIVGFNGRGKAHINAYLKMPNVEIAALCDVDQSVVDSGLKAIESAGKKRPETYADIRRVLDDKSIDAVSIATPNFHHTLQTIWAVQAGKDVYVEKPVSYNMFEAQQIIAASRKYNRIVQDGTGAQLWLHEAKKKIQDGIIGDVYMARGLVFKWRDTIGRAKEEPVPPGVAYDLWTGPAPAKPFTKNRFHYSWHWQWDYGNGDIGNQGAHQMHSARTALGVKYPTKISSMGGHYLFDDDQETPNTQLRDIRVRGWREEKAARVRSPSLDLEQRSGHRRALVADGRRRRATAADRRQHLVRIEGVSRHEPRRLADLHGPWTGTGPEVGSGHRLPRFRQLHRRRPQPEARGSARGRRGGRHFDNADSPGEHLVPHRAHVVFRSRHLHVQRRRGSDGHVHAWSVPGAVYRSERRRHADGVRPAEDPCSLAGGRNRRSGDCGEYGGPSCAE